ncbi:WD40 repeat-containing protein [Heterostelium album PN500]|uniref:WD40 repeat-containing protein n=1 Tax=Heterostelium pallidum (strain ATCC 26659 / Pp 5 / PN500) TaxID=670386 RepID=D3B8U6_HETP5|nr:WD40 repeat-containing protein [Heterostelium album PN500]EFA82464.1 WD40 repeat-containing protein [Heterostelium album PN500]|eukprot:XP_020434581.1 WD40 repeat-containing protein [Heterostelium album PN500]
MKKKADKLKGFQVDKILEQINYYITTYDIVHLVELWNFLDSTFFNRIDYTTHYGFKSSVTSTHKQDFSTTVKKLANSLKKFYLITAVNNGKLEKVREFFDYYSSELVKDPDWKHWFALPYIRSPQSDPLFEVYFNKAWSEAFSSSLRNFLSTIFKNIPLPKILQFNLERQNRKRLETQLENLINQNEELRSQVDKLEYQIKREMNTGSSSSSTNSSNDKDSTTNNNNNNNIQGFSRVSRRTTDSKERDLKQSTLNSNSTTTDEEEKEKVVIGSVRSRKSIQNTLTASFEMTEMDEIGKKQTNSSVKSPNISDPSYIVESQEVCTSHTSPVTRCKFSSNGSKIASSSVDGTVRVWNVDGFSRHTTIYCLSEVISLEWENKTKLLLCGTTDSKIKLWNSTTDKAIGDINTSQEYPRVEDLVCNPNGNSFASSSTNNGRTDGIVYTWNFRTLKTEDRLSSSNAIINSMCYNNNGTLLATGCVDGTIRIFDIKSCQAIGGWQAHSSEILAVQFYNDDNKIFSLGKDGRLNQWNIHTMGKPEKEYEYPGFPIDTHRTTKISFNSDGTSFVVGSNNKYALIYNVENNSPVAKIGGHSGPVVTVDWHPTMSSCVTGSLDQTVRLSKLSKNTQFS